MRLSVKLNLWKNCVSHRLYYDEGKKKGGDRDDHISILHGNVFVIFVRNLSPGYTPVLLSSFSFSDSLINSSHWCVLAMDSDHSSTCRIHHISTLG